MTALVVAALVAAVAVVAGCLQVLSRQLRHLPLDQRRTDPLIDVSRRRVGSVRPAELHQLTTVVANAILSDASFRNELRPILDQIDPGPADPPKADDRSARGLNRPGTGRRRRSGTVEQAIADLEAGYHPQGDGARRR